MEWISVNDRLPEAGQMVVVYRPDAPKSCDPIYKVATFKGAPRLGREHGFDCYVAPTHWTPLTPAE